MSRMTEPSPQPDPMPALPEALTRNAGWLIVVGLVLIVGGTAAILAPLVAGLAVLSIIGFVFFVAGIVQIAQAFGARGWRGALWHIVIGVLYLLGGVLVLLDPFAGLIAAALVIAATFLAGGVVRLAAAWQLHPEPGWGFVALAGIASLVAGVVIWANLPGDAAVVLGLVAGISFLIEGWGMLGLGLAARRAA